jgi:hypothetical protein
VKLNGILHILTPLPHKFDLHASLLENLAHGRVVGKLVSFYMPARRKPHPEFAMEMQEYFAPPYYEDRDREVPA